MLRRWAIVLAALVVSAWVHGSSVPTYTYYVDQINGSNANNGASPATALKDITSLPTLTAGQSVGLACNGSHWREQLTVTAAHVTVAGYPVSGMPCSSSTLGASGNLPILDASNILPNAGFTADGSGGYCTGTITFTLGGTDAWANGWETGGPGDSATGQQLQVVTSQALMDSTPGSEYIAGMTSSNMPTSGAVCIHATDSSNVSTNGYMYEVAQRTGIMMTGLGGVVENVEARKSQDNNGVFDLEGDGDSYTVTNVIARDGGKHNLLVPGGSTVSNSLLIDGYFPTNASFLVFHDATGSGLPVNSTDNIYQLDNNIAGNGDTIGIISHTSTGSFGAFTSTGDWFIAKNSANLAAIEMADVTSANVVGGYSSQLQELVYVQGPTTINGHQYVSAYSGEYFIQDNTAGANPTIENSSICGSNLLSFDGLIFLPGGSLTLTLTANKIFLQSPITNPIAVGASYVSNVAVVANGNDFGSAVASWSPYNIGPSGAMFSGNNNIYESSAHAPNFQFNGTTYSTLAAWQAEVSPADAASTETGGNAVTACTLPTIPSVN